MLPSACTATAAPAASPEPTGVAAPPPPNEESRWPAPSKRAIANLPTAPSITVPAITILPSAWSARAFANELPAPMGSRIVPLSAKAVSTLPSLL